ncbi:MAG TPA: phosphotransferase [Firmicutes bacterium]|nr:phosphotransferase [Bacillota bacterium]
MNNETLKRLYGWDITDVKKSTIGAGSDTYFVSCQKGRYVVKFPSASEINNPDFEPALCEFLLSKGIAVSEFLKNINGQYISTDENGRKFHVQKFIDGKVYAVNTAPKWLLRESAALLGKIHTALAGYPSLPEGIGEKFFAAMTPEAALNSYQNTLAIAQENQDIAIQDDLLYRIDLMKRFPGFRFNLGSLTCRNTHGDFFISQLICGEQKIKAVIDWTTACVHPAVWEIIRSYVYASPKCREGVMDMAEFVEYLSIYLEYAPLTAADIDAMPKLFYYQLAVCDYYHQYYQSKAANRSIYLHQAVFSTNLMKWLEKNLDSLSQELSAHFSKQSKQGI